MLQILPRHSCTSVLFLYFTFLYFLYLVSLYNSYISLGTTCTKSTLPTWAASDIDVWKRGVEVCSLELETLDATALPAVMRSMFRELINFVPFSPVTSLECGVLPDPWLVSNYPLLDGTKMSCTVIATALTCLYISMPEDELCAVDPMDKSLAAASPH